MHHYNLRNIYPKQTVLLNNSVKKICIKNLIVVYKQCKMRIFHNMTLLKKLLEKDVL